ADRGKIALVEGEERRGVRAGRVAHQDEPARAAVGPSHRAPEMGDRKRAILDVLREDRIGILAVVGYGDKVTARRKGLAEEAIKALAARAPVAAVEEDDQRGALRVLVGDMEVERLAGQGTERDVALHGVSRPAGDEIEHLGP